MEFERTHRKLYVKKPLIFSQKNEGAFVERHARENNKAFSLIELIAVITILVILAGLIIGGSRYYMRKAYESRAKAEIAAMAAALEAYKADQGAYPPLDPERFYSIATSGPILTNSTRFLTNSGGTVNVPLSFTNGFDYSNVQIKHNSWMNSHHIHKALFPSDGSKIYMNFSPKQLKVCTNDAANVIYNLILDPFGNPYGYNPLDPKGNPNTFDLFSSGSDGKPIYPTLDPNGDDLGNWQRH